MGAGNDGDGFRGDAAHPIEVRGCPVREVSRHPGDSAMAARSFKLLKRERIGRLAHPIREDAGRGKFRDTGMFHDPKRQHTNNSMLSPVDFGSLRQKRNRAGVRGARLRSGVSARQPGEQLPLNDDRGRRCRA